MKLHIDNGNEGFYLQSIGKPGLRFAFVRIENTFVTSAMNSIISRATGSAQKLEVSQRSHGQCVSGGDGVVLYDLSKFSAFDVTSKRALDLILDAVLTITKIVLLSFDI